MAEGHQAASGALATQQLVVGAVAVVATVGDHAHPTETEPRQC